MPIYEYQCKSCAKVFEYSQRISDAPKKTCEECKGKLERLISQTSFHLKGGGWYKDLYSSTKKEGGAGEGGSNGAKESDASAPERKASSDGASDKSESKASSDGSSDKKATKKDSGSETKAAKAAKPVKAKKTGS